MLSPSQYELADGMRPLSKHDEITSLYVCTSRLTLSAHVRLPSISDVRHLGLFVNAARDLGRVCVCVCVCVQVVYSILI